MLRNILRVVSFCCLLSDYLWGLLRKSFFFNNLERSRTKREKKNLNWGWNIFKFKDERVLFTENSFKEGREHFYLGNLLPSLEQLRASKAHRWEVLSQCQPYILEKKNQLQDDRWQWAKFISGVGWLEARGYTGTFSRRNTWGQEKHVPGITLRNLQKRHWWKTRLWFNRGQLCLQTKNELHILG